MTHDNHDNHDDPCPVRDETDPEGWTCCRVAGHEEPHRPMLSKEGKAAILNAESLDEALFDLANLFRVPVTNNIPWLENGEPIYEVAEFMDLVAEVCMKFSPKVVIEQHLNKPTTCQVWRDGVLIFDGQDKSAKFG